MSAIPDVAGFAAAQERLIDVLGTDVVFHTKVDATWGPDVQLDPQTNRPYDPTVVPRTPEGWVDVGLRVGKVQRQLNSGGGDNVADTAAGVVREASAGLIVKVSDFPSVQDADEVTIGTERFRITDTVSDKLGDAVRRHIVYLESK